LPARGATRAQQPSGIQATQKGGMPLTTGSAITPPSLDRVHLHVHRGGP
jgi:hypothetical protein